MHVHVLGICGYATFGAATLALDRGDQTLEIPFEEIVIGACAHSPDRGFLTHMAGHENEGSIQIALANHRQGRGSAETGQRVIGNDQIP